MNKRILATFCVIILMMCQFIIISPQEVFADTPGSDLVIRVGYKGDPKDYKVKATLSQSQINSLAQETNRYTNVSKDGTVKSFIAQGPAITSILEAAEITVRKVYFMDLRTVGGGGIDGRFEENRDNPTYTRRAYLQGGRYYYPNLESNWEKKGSNGIPKEGALADGQPVSTILAVKSSNEDTHKPTNGAQGLTPEMMSTSGSYRFCAGQTPLTEGVETDSKEHATAEKNAKSIYGIDVTLTGTPVENIDLIVDESRIIAGYKVQATAVITANPLFIKNPEDVELVWTSSNHEIATIDDKGLIHFKKKGSVEIGVTTKELGPGVARGFNVSEEKNTGDKDDGDNGDNGDDGDDGSAAVIIKKPTGKDEGTENKKPVYKSSKTKTKKEVEAKKEAKAEKDAKAEKEPKKKSEKEKKGTRAKQVSVGDEIGAGELNADEKYSNAVPVVKRKANISILFMAGFTAAVFFIGGAITRVDAYLKER